MLENLRILHGNSNPELAKKISAILQIAPVNAPVERYSDGEIRITDIEESVRGLDCFIIQSTCPPVNENLMELLIMIDALKRASAKRITAVLPYYGYARQDKKVFPRAPITAKLVADLIAVAGAHRVLCLELHAGQIQGFFNIPVDHLFTMKFFARYLLEEEKIQKEIVIMSPDSGGVPRARALAKLFNANIAIADKRRDSPNEVKEMRIIGEVYGTTVFILDDIVDTAGTLVETEKALIKRGAVNVFACCVHPVLSGPALERIKQSEIKKIIVTDTIPLKTEAKNCEKFKVISVANLLAEAIEQIHTDGSVSSLF